jgi:hypothetical protein
MDDSLTDYIKKDWEELENELEKFTVKKKPIE